MADDIRVNKIVAEWEHAREPGAPVAFEPIGDAVPELKRRAEAPESPLVPTGYELHEQVGIGGMGVVFRGFHRSLGREVALKFLRRCYSTDSIAARKFIEEARITACLQHPGIPAVHEVGELDDGRPYLAMKLVRGRTLADLFKEQGYGAAKWLGIFESICQAVGAAHEDDYMHRDLKPANVMIGKFGEVQVMDWGLAKKVPQSVPTPGARTSGATRISEGDGTVDTGPERDTDQTKPHEAHAEIFADETEYGQAKGTPRYMPAEQARGEIDRIDRRVDVFALGAILCEILTGHPPLTSTGMIFKAQVVAGDYSEAGIRLDQCGEDGELISLAKRCLATEPADRPRDASELAKAVAKHRSEAELRAKQAEIGRAKATVQVAEQKKRRRVLTVSGALLVVALVFGIAGTTIGLLKAEEKTDQALRDKSKADAETIRADAEKGIAVQALNESARILDIARLGNARGAFDNNLVSLARDTLASISPDHRGIEWGILGRQIAGSRLALEDHGGGVNSVAFCPDGLRVATSSADNTVPVRIWDAIGGKILLEHKDHLGAMCVAWSPDGLRFATGSANSDLPACIWEAATGKRERVLYGHADQSMVLGIAWSPDGTRVATASSDRTARIYDAATGRCQHTLQGHQGGVNCVAWALDSTRIATASDDSSVRIWNAEAGLESKVLIGHSGQAKSVAWHLDGTKLVTSAMDNTVRIWDADTGKTTRQLVGHANFVFGVAWSPDGTRIATASGDKTARVWNANSGETLLDLKGHTNLVSCVAFSKDGKSLVTGSYDRTARIWDAHKTGLAFDDIKTVVTPGLRAVRFSDGTNITTGSLGPIAYFGDASPGSTVRPLPHPATAGCIALNSAGTRAATGCDDGTVRIWTATPGKPPQELKGHTGKVTGIAYSSDGSKLATASLDHSVCIWNAYTGEFLDKLSGHLEGVNDLAWDPTGTRLATTTNDQKARIWDAQTYRLIRELTGHTGSVACVSWNADGSRIATGSADKTARIWNPETGEPIREFRGLAEGVLGVVWTPDGRRIVTTTTYTKSNPKTVRVWDVVTAQSLLELECATMRSLSISADGTRILTGKMDGSIRIWSPNSTETVAGTGSFRKK